MIKYSLIISLAITALCMTACGETAADIPVQTAVPTAAETVNSETKTETEAPLAEESSATVTEITGITSAETTVLEETTSLTASITVSAENAEETTVSVKSTDVSVRQTTVSGKVSGTETAPQKDKAKPSAPDDKRCTELLEALEYSDKLHLGYSDVIEYDTGDVKKIDDEKYYRVTKSEFSSIKEMREYFLKYASPELVDGMLLRLKEYYPPFMESDGKLYIEPYDNDLWPHFSYLDGTRELTKVSDEEYKLTLDLETEYGRGIFDFTLDYIDGQWKLTDENCDIIENEDEYDYVDDDEILGADPDTWGSYSGDYEIYDGFSVNISIFNDCTGYAVYDEDYCRIGSLVNDTDTALDNWNVIADDIDGDGVNELGAVLENGETLWFAYDEYGVWSDSNPGGCFVRVKNTAN